MTTMIKPDVITSNLMLREIRKTHPISRKEEKDLFAEYLRSTPHRKQEIRKKIIESNMRFVLKVALEYKNVKGIDLAEAITEGKLGLFKAFDDFNCATGNKFISFAIWWIRAKITQYLKENDLIRLPIYQKNKLIKAKQKETTAELDPKMQYLNELTGHHISVDDTVKEGNLSLSEVIKDDRVEDLEKLHLNKKLRENLLDYLTKNLNKEERAVITNLYGIETGNALGLRDVKELIGKSHERVRQIRDKALHSLRKSNDIKALYGVFFDINDDC